MATRSLIGRVIEDGNKIEYIYCHWDGYIDGGVGETLVKCYSGTPDDKGRDFMFELGDLSVLGINLTSKETNAYHRDLGEPRDRTKSRVIPYIDWADTGRSWGADFLHLWDGKIWKHTEL